MEESGKVENNKRPRNVEEDAEDMEKVLAVVVKRRKTVPAKCMKIMRETAMIEIQQLEKSKVCIEEDKDKENIKKIVQNVRKLKSSKFSFDDLLEAKNRFIKYSTRAAEMSNYLQKRNQCDYILLVGSPMGMEKFFILYKG